MIDRSIHFFAANMVLVGVLAGCAPYTLVDAERFEVKEAYSVDPQQEWSRLRNSHHEIWTVDGQSLEAVHLWAGVEDGEALISGRDEDDKDVPVYRNGMRAGDIADLVAATVTIGGGDATVANLRPAPFGDLQGFRFSLAYANQNGLDKRALALGGITGEGKLHLIVYDGAAEYYFTAHRQTAEALFDSVDSL